MKHARDFITESCIRRKGSKSKPAPTALTGAKDGIRPFKTQKSKSIGNPATHSRPGSHNHRQIYDAMMQLHASSKDYVMNLNQFNALLAGQVSTRGSVHSGTEGYTSMRNKNTLHAGTG